MRLMLAEAIPTDDGVVSPSFAVDGWASAKLDGIRVGCYDGAAATRNGKPIPNNHIRKLLSSPLCDGLDAEIIVGAPTGAGVFDRVTSAVRSKEGEPAFKLHVFDLLNQPDVPFHGRYEMYQERCYRLRNDLPFLVPVRQRRVVGLEELLRAEDEFLTSGYEGLMYRKFAGGYKYGRSTQKEAHLLKLKRWSELEAEVVGTYEQQENLNEATTDILGRTVRSSHQENKVGKATLGGFICRAPQFKWVFNVGIGMPGMLPNSRRDELWAVRESLTGQYIRVAYVAYGSKDGPRFPKFNGFRMPEDMS